MDTIPVSYRSRRKQRNISWLLPFLQKGVLIFLGLLVGAGIGFFLGWRVWPTEYTAANLTILEEPYQIDYAVMIATNYALDGDLSAAQTRLISLGKPNTNDWLLQTTINLILNTPNSPNINNMVALANDLGLYSPTFDPFLNR